MVKKLKKTPYKIPPLNENRQFLEDGASILRQMMDKYPNGTKSDFDNILNGICASLIFFKQTAIEKPEQKNFLLILYKTLEQDIITGDENHVNERDI